jgi:hypothetical protein
VTGVVGLQREEEFLPEEEERERVPSRRILLLYRKALMKTWNLASTLHQTGPRAHNLSRSRGREVSVKNYWHKYA